MEALIIAIVGAQGFWTVILYLLQRRDRKKDPESRLLLGIAHDRIVYLCGKAIERGSATTGEIDNISQIYEPYKELGGNGTGKAMYEKFMKLPLKGETDEKD